MIRVVVADDQAAVRAGLVLVLRAAPDIEVVGEAGDGEEAVAQCRRWRPQVVVMDLRMPRMGGISATREVTAEGTAQVLVLTTFDLDEYVFGALRAGAAGFVLKDIDAADLIAAVRTVAAGDGVVAPALTRRLIDAFAATTGPPLQYSTVAGLSKLTSREREVLGCLGRGLSNAEIGAVLGIAEPTAKVHVRQVLGKLNVHSRVQAALLARDLDREPPPTRHLR